MFIDLTLDTLSYVLMSSFLILLICVVLLILIYPKTTSISKWNKSIKEFLAETNLKYSGIVMYHMVFIIRRVILCINIIMFNSLGANSHISIHVACQVLVVLIM